MVEIFDKNGSDEIGVGDPQTANSAVVIAKYFAVFFHQGPVVIWQTLYKQ